MDGFPFPFVGFAALNQFPLRVPGDQTRAAGIHAVLRRGRRARGFVAVPDRTDSRRADQTPKRTSSDATVTAAEYPNTFGNHTFGFISLESLPTNGNSSPCQE